MLIDEIKIRATRAMKAGNTLEKEILRVALGEIQTSVARGGGSDDEVAGAIVRKLIKSNEETMGMSTDAEQKQTLAKEVEVLRSLLPQSLTVDQIVELLAPVAAPIRAAGNDGQATGVAMKHLKTSGAIVGGKDVGEAVKRVRAATT